MCKIWSCALYHNLLLLILSFLSSPIPTGGIGQLVGGKTDIQVFYYIGYSKLKQINKLSKQQQQQKKNPHTQKTPHPIVAEVYVKGYEAMLQYMYKDYVVC